MTKNKYLECIFNTGLPVLYNKYGVSIKWLRAGFCSTGPDLCGQLKCCAGKLNSFPLILFILLLFHNK